MVATPSVMRPMAQTQSLRLKVQLVAIKSQAWRLMSQPLVPCMQAKSVLLVPKKAWVSSMLVASLLVQAAYN